MIVQAKIKTNSKEFKIIKKKDHWIIHIRSKPEKNKANLEIIKELSKKYGKCRILKGKKSKNKILEIQA